jgi:PAS domain-containing protein
VRFEDEREGIWYDNVYYPVRDAQGAVTRVALLARDITERKRMEEALRRSLDEADRGHRLLLALSQAAQAVQRARTPEEVYQTIGDGVAGLGYDAVIFALADDGAHFDLAHMTYEPAKVRGAEKLLGLLGRDLLFPLPLDSVFPDKDLRSEAVFTESASTIMAEWLPAPLRPLAKQLAGLFGAEQMIHAPLMAGGEIHGLLIVAGSGLTEAHAQAVSAFANQAAIALENARLYQETRAWASPGGACPAAPRTAGSEPGRPGRAAGPHPGGGVRDDWRRGGRSRLPCHRLHPWE